VLQYVAGVACDDGATLAVYNVAVGNTAGGCMPGNFGALVIVAHDGEELDFEIVDKVLGCVRGAILAEEDDIHLAGFFDVLIGFDNVRHFLAARAAPAGGIQENEIVCLFVNTPFDLFDFFERRNDGADSLLCFLGCFLDGGLFGFIAPMALAGMPAEKRPAACIGCRSCEAVCPQQIKISEVLADFVKVLSE
jgi:NAD-dependent dihydropyrimidine dehydrogenase PreA subunit